MDNLQTYADAQLQDVDMDQIQGGYVIIADIIGG